MEDDDPPPTPAVPTIRHSDGSVRTGETIAGPLPLPLKGGRVEQCCLDNALTLTLEVSARSWSLRIETPFVLVPPAESSERFESSENAPPSAWGPAADVLLHNTIVDANVASDGTLELGFADGYRLHVSPSDQWEAWQFIGPSQEVIVCGPGGGLARWRAPAR